MSVDEAKFKGLWEGSQNLAKKCSVAELKAYCKSIGLPGNGDVTTLAKRVQAALDVKYLGLGVAGEGGELTSPYQLKLPDLRRIVAQLGMDPSGDKDELHFSLIDYLKQKRGTGAGSTSSNAGSGGGAGSSSGQQEGVIVKQILSMKDDFPAVLSSSGINISVDSSVATMRKAYLKLSLLIHPDRCKVPEATKAFQLLVTAFERMSQPELLLEEQEEDDEEEEVGRKKGEKKKKVVRSNDGCHRTRLFCPRCKAEWGLPDSGVEPYDYNFMMMGLRTFNCAGCLCEFGAMTATHKCPHCNRPFEYHPKDYHRKISCGNAKCSKQFGFFLFPISDRMEKEVRAQIRARQEKELKEREQQEDRARRAGARFKGTQPEASGKHQLYILNLLDACPKCGAEEVDLADRAAHLDGCKDKEKIAAYAKKLREEARAVETKEAKAKAQTEVQNLSSWDFLGGKTSDLWLLSEGQLRGLCKEYGLDGEGEKDTLIGRIVKWKNSLDSKRMITDGSGDGDGDGGAGGSKIKKAKVTVADLPANMESMSVGQLKAVCASFGIPSSHNTKSALILEIEKKVHGKEMMLQITEGKSKKK